MLVSYPVSLSPALWLGRRADCRLDRRSEWPRRSGATRGAGPPGIIALPPRCNLKLGPGSRSSAAACSGASRFASRAPAAPTPIPTRAALCRRYTHRASGCRRARVRDDYPADHGAQPRPRHAGLRAHGDLSARGAAPPGRAGPGRAGRPVPVGRLGPVGGTRRVDTAPRNGMNCEGIPCLGAAVHSQAPSPPQGRMQPAGTQRSCRGRTSVVSRVAVGRAAFSGSLQNMPRSRLSSCSGLGFVSQIRSSSALSPSTLGC